MKVETLLLHLLIIRSLTLSGLRERISNERAKESVCYVKCENDKEPEECKKKCKSDQRTIPEFDIEAGANVTHFCQVRNSATIVIDSGVFAIEYRNQSSDWVWYRLENCSIAGDRYYETTIDLPGGRYQWRYTRVFADGISRPEVTNWVTWREPGIKPKYFPDFWIRCLVFHPILSITTAEIGFRVAEEDVSCFFHLECSQDQGNYNQSIDTFLDVQAVHSEPKVTFVDNIEYFEWEREELYFHRLPLGENFTVSIRAPEPRFFGDETFVKFRTPSLQEFGNMPAMICVPRKIEEFNATVIYHEKENNYDVTVTWRTPDLDPDFFMIGLTVNERSWSLQNVSGMLTQTTFWNVTIRQQFNVSIRGSSYLGRGPETLKSFTNPYKPLNPSGSGTINIAAVVSSVSFMVVIGGCAYLVYMRLKRRQRRIKASKIYKDEIDPDRLTITRVLGSGNFGVVKFGRLRDDEGRVIAVAVKMLRDDTNETELRNFRFEIEMMKSLDKHPNIVSLVGYRTSGFHPFLVVEYCPNGDLLSFLRTASLKTARSTDDEENKLCVSRPGPSNEDTVPEENSEELSETSSVDVDGYVDTVDTKQGATVTILDLLNFGRQIATGMEYLSSKRIVHRDLAARKILIFDKGVVKISDFGLSRDIYRENMYKKTGNGQMPFKWMAIESLMHQVYTTQSDVWSFGILLWEIITLGVTPYPGVPTIEIFKRLQTGYRMERPDICSDALYNVMLSCWNANPKKRPTFTVLRKQLDRFIRVAAEHEYIDADYISVGMALDEDLIPSSPAGTSCPLRASFTNDLEPRVALEGLDQKRVEADDSAEDCSE